MYLKLKLNSNFYVYYQFLKNTHIANSQNGELDTLTRQLEVSAVIFDEILYSA